MSCPRSFQDDGQTLRLDVHHCTISEAMRLVTRCLQEGQRRGRNKLEVVTGYSTTTVSDVPTIKNTLEKALADGGFGRNVASWLWSPDGGRCIIALPFGGTPGPGRVRLSDLI